jgi:hypothetical protein
MQAAATGDQRAKTQFDQMLRDMEAANNRIAELTTKPTKQLLAENAAQLHQNLNQLSTSLTKGLLPLPCRTIETPPSLSLARIPHRNCAGDKEAAKALLGDTQKGLLKQQNLVKAQANRTTDPRQRKDLLAALHDLERVLNDLPLSVRSAINNPADNPRAINDINLAHGAVNKYVLPYAAERTSLDYWPQHCGECLPPLPLLNTMLTQYLLSCCSLPCTGVSTR